MKKILVFFAIISFMSLTAFTHFSLKNWSISDNYEVKFQGKSAKGIFSQLNGSIIFDENNLSNSQMDVYLLANTIDTGNKTKNKHAKGKNWLHAEKFPRINFQSSSFQKTDSGYLVKGQLELHGIKKEVSIPFTFKNENERGLFEGSFSVKRKDYGIKGPLAGFTVGNTISVSLKVPVE